MFNAFSITIVAGYGYDLDIRPGQDPASNSGWQGDDPTYIYRDLYRTKDGTNKLQGVQQPVTATNHNPISKVSAQSKPDACRALTLAGGGNVLLSTADVGTKICLKTREGRWAMLTVTDSAPTQEDALGLDVVVLNK